MNTVSFRNFIFKTYCSKFMKNASSKMSVLKYTTSIAAGAAGLAAGLIYHHVASHRKFLISAAKPIKLEIDAIISRDVEEYVAKLTPVMKHGFPSHEAIRIKDNFIISYDRRLRNPNWVMEHLTSDMVEEEISGDRKKSKFFEDVTIHSYFRATLDDYRNSDYDRGHLAAAANHKHCQRAVDNTFVLSNITPQNPYFNQVTWKALEKHVRFLVGKYGSVYVCSGPLYLPREIPFEEDQFLEGKQKKRKRYQISKAPAIGKKYVIYEVIGENNVAVPTHFFKIVLCEVDEDKYDMEAYIVPNEKLDPKPLSNYMVPRDTIERAAGFRIFHQLPPSMLRYINGEDSETEP